MERNVGLLIVVVGIAIVLLGVLVWAGGLSWFGHLPGDIRIERGNLRIYIPVISMLLTGGGDHPAFRAAVSVSALTSSW